ncbi:MAG: bifunctional 4-hydroxy-2-oxoglutarate aldolase/2-dehydro-3-deoxy-phosphogluconate aldolase [Anaerolineae bacterium]|nr:bifunctional 4-hydroxy-2-oxoglutarate aldolase/2-dehydro-3-deoxy-phosphogluconate aldolase [Anaerolineae bacterium]NUQ04227.1 bifunctional 4-hydroxy-2-oxoglutarate aldolase/2-dehydro-3-deoxy-phosphogluconate aldolase [Anaerolineae bacterium]
MARFDRLTVYSTLLQDGMMPLFYHGQVETARAVTSALAEGGSRALEFTNRGEDALEVFAALVKYCAAAHPNMIVGIGSVDDAATAALYIAHGANFIVGPTFNEETARLCNRRKIAYMPGCGTLNEIAAAEEWGAEIVKLFPGAAAGGPGFVKDALAPRPWTRLMPTGGVTPEEDNLRAWFDAGVAAVGMGSRLLRSDWIAAGNYEAISHLTQATLNVIRRVRSK